MKVGHVKQHSNFSILFQKSLFLSEWNRHNDKFRFTKVYRFFFKCDHQFILPLSNLTHWHMGMLAVLSMKILPKDCKPYGQTFNRHLKLPFNTNLLIPQGQNNWKENVLMGWCCLHPHMFIGKYFLCSVHIIQWHHKIIMIVVYK